MKKRASKFIKGQPDFFTKPGDPDSVTEAEEAAARSTEKERMVTSEESKRRWAIINTKREQTRKMLAEKAREAEEKERQMRLGSLKIR